MSMKIVAFLATTIIYGIVYMVLDKADPNAFGFGSWIDPFYFSFTTMSTVGYGDWLPQTDVAQDGGHESPVYPDCRNSHHVLRW